MFNSLQTKDGLFSKRKRVKEYLFVGYLKSKGSLKLPFLDAI